MARDHESDVIGVARHLTELDLSDDPEAAAARDRAVAEAQTVLEAIWAMKDYLEQQKQER